MLSVPLRKSSPNVQRGRGHESLTSRAQQVSAHLWVNQEDIENSFLPLCLSVRPILPPQ